MFNNETTAGEIYLSNLGMRHTYLSTIIDSLDRAEEPPLCVRMLTIRCVEWNIAYLTMDTSDSTPFTLCTSLEVVEL